MHPNNRVLRQLSLLHGLCVNVALCHKNSPINHSFTALAQAKKRFCASKKYKLPHHMLHVIRCCSINISSLLSASSLLGVAFTSLDFVYRTLSCTYRAYALKPAAGQSRLQPSNLGSPRNITISSGSVALRQFFGYEATGELFFAQAFHQMTLHQCVF